MIEHNKNFYSLEELKRTRDNLEGYLDNEEVYYFVGAIRYACDEIERLNNIIKRLETDLYNMYITFGEFSEEYTENRIKELKGSDKE
ncbi:MAG: hypothetical protein IKL65_00510 [Bacilli bacterium]|nr:hypothetical protein [Bacilli bacterium]MBR6689798.1 hypothetical protein [Bacilli bacterium]